MDKNKLTFPSTSLIAFTAGWFSKSWKRLLGTLVGTLVVQLFCLHLWTDSDMIGLVLTPFNKKAGIEITYSGVTGSDPFTVVTDSPLGDKGWCVDTNFHRYTAEFETGWEWKKFGMRLCMKRGGEIRIRLVGSDKSNDYGEKYSVFSDYQNLSINGKSIFSDRRKLGSTKPFSYRFPVKAGDDVKIEFETRRHHFTAADFNLAAEKNFWYVVTLSIISFILFYNLLRHISTMRAKGKAEDTVFLTFFFSLLIIPLSEISDAQRSERELRPLTRRPVFEDVLVLQKSADLGRRFEKWFCDHLCGRDTLIKLHSVIRKEMQQIIQVPRAWYIQDDGWIFIRPFAWSPNAKWIQPVVKNLAELAAFCEKNHIKFYVFVVPRKESVYREWLYGYGVNQKKIALENAIHEKVKYLVAKQHVTYVYPLTELREANKQDYTFFKLTHHWTDWGAYVGYCTLMKEVRRDFPNIPIASLGDYKLTRSSLIRDEWKRNFHHGWLQRFFGFKVDRRCKTIFYNYYDHKNAGKLMTKVGECTKDFSYRGGVYKIMVLGTSQNENLLSFLPYSGGRTRYIRLNKNKLPMAEHWKIMKYHKKDILSYKPDILILSTCANRWAFPYLQNLTSK